MKPDNNAIDQILAARRDDVLRDWLAEVSASASATARHVTTAREDAQSLLKALHEGVRADGDPSRLQDPAWERVRGLLEGLSSSRAAKGLTAADTSHFVLALKRPLFAGLQNAMGTRPGELVSAVWSLSTLVDQMAQLTIANYQRNREEIISRQQQELLELSTPVVKLWDSVLAVPMIGTLDSSRTQLVMESLLQRIVETGAEIAIIDITGVPTVDTLVAQHLLKTVTAIRLMGADCIISGVRPQIAQTIVHLGIDLQGITTKSSLADALALAM